jgi:hypothetical protein
MAKNTAGKPPKKNTQYQAHEWEWPKDCRLGGLQWARETRIAYIKHLFSRGILDPDRGPLAAQMGVCARMLYDDFQLVYKRGLDPREIDQTKIKLAAALKNAVAEASAHIIRSNGKERLQAITTLGSIAKDYVEFLEKFDIKKPGEIDQAKPLVIRWEEDEK